MGGHLRSGTAAAFRKALPVCSNWLRPSDVTAATFHTTNQREGDARIVFHLARKGRGTVSEAANGRPGGGAPVGAAAGTVASPEAGRALCIHGASRGAEVSGACSLPSRSLQSPAEEGKTTTALGEAAALRPRSGLLSAPPTRRHQRERGGQGPRRCSPLPGRLPGRRHTSVELKPGMTSPQTEIVFFLPSFFF